MKHFLLTQLLPRSLHAQISNFQRAQRTHSAKQVKKQEMFLLEIKKKTLLLEIFLMELFYQIHFMISHMV